MKKTLKTGSRPPLGELNPNTLGTGRKTSLNKPTGRKTSEPAGVNKGDLLFESLMRKTQELQNDLSQLRDSFCQEGSTRRKSSSFYSVYSQNTQNSNESPLNYKTLDLERAKLKELNDNLLRNNAFLSNKIKLMEEREAQLVKLICQLRQGPKEDSCKDDLLGLFSKYQNN